MRDFSSEKWELRNEKSDSGTFTSHFSFGIYRWEVGLKREFSFLKYPSLISALVAPVTKLSSKEHQIQLQTCREQSSAAIIIKLWEGKRRRLSDRWGFDDLAATRLRHLGVWSGEFCVCKLIVSTWSRQVGSIKPQIITKPATCASKLSGHKSSAGAFLQPGLWD